MIALPLKDWFIHSTFFKFLYPETGIKRIKDKRIKELNNQSDIVRLFKILLKEFNINYMSMVTLDRTIKQLDFSKVTEKKKNPVQIQNEEFNKISRFFQYKPVKSISGNIPEEIKAVTERFGWNILVPIYYKSKYLGFIGAPFPLDTKNISILEDLAARAGLIFENDLLTESAMRNESFKKEFTLARQIEKFLLLEESISTSHYIVSAEKNLFDGLSFPVLFEKSLNQNKQENPFYIFCRISKSDKRMRTMMLFMITGYFLTHSKYVKKLPDLVRLLNKSLLENGSEFSIDGFVFQSTSVNTWNIHYFGKNVQIESDTEDISLSKTSSLGLQKNIKLTSVNLKNKNEIVLSINHVSGVKINRK